MRPVNLRLIDSGSAALLRRLVAENFRPQAKRYGLAAAARDVLNLLVLSIGRAF